MRRTRYMLIKNTHTHARLPRACTITRETVRTGGEVQKRWYRVAYCTRPGKNVYDKEFDKASRPGQEGASALSMYGGGREKKTKSARRSQQAAAEDAATSSRRDRGGSKSGKKAERDEEFFTQQSQTFFSDMLGDAPQRRSATAETVFVQWDELLRSREALKQRLDTIAAVHGWETPALGGIEPDKLVVAMRAEVAALEPAADHLERADLLLELHRQRAKLDALSGERDRAAAEAAEAREDGFEARTLLAEQADEIAALRQRMVAREVGGAHGQIAGGKAAGKTADTATAEGASSVLVGAGDASSSSSASATASAFSATLARGQTSEGREVVHALERLKLPDEAAMGARELACWHENKKTIVNSLRTLSSQIYSGTVRILYELIQNADDCVFADDDGAPPCLHLECSEEALVAYHNERGFQPRDLYAMCQVGESSKRAGSGKIGRKGIGFKSVFQVSFPGETGVEPSRRAPDGEPPMESPQWRAPNGEPPMESPQWRAPEGESSVEPSL